MHTQSIRWLLSSLRVKAKFVTVAYKGLQNLSFLQPLLSPATFPQILSAPATLVSLHFFFNAVYSCLRAFALLFPLSRKVLTRYYVGPLPRFLHIFDQCHHLIEAMSCILPFLSDLSLLHFLPCDILLHLLIVCFSPSKIYAT